MIVLNKPFHDLTREDVVRFLESGIPEGQQIDYKSDTPSKDLSRYFASFANSRGGVIFFGVHEDPSTGLPDNLPGLRDPAKIIDSIHQCATNVDPRPQYELRTFELESGTCLVLLKIYEGDKPPYFIQNSGRILIRTGSITDGLKTGEREAYPEEIRYLFGKAQKAKEARDLRQELGDRICKATIATLEQERSLTEPAERKGAQKYPVGLKSMTALLSLSIQPFYPNKEIATVPEIDTKIREYAVMSQNYGFPLVNRNKQSTHGGILHYGFSYTEGAEIEQLNTFGYLEKRVNILKVDEQDGQVRKILMTHTLFSHVFTLALSAAKFYKVFHYVGPLHFSISLDTTEIAGLEVRRMFFDTKTTVIPSKLTWDYSTDTRTLQEAPTKKEFLRRITNDIYQSLGLNFLDDFSFDSFLQYERIGLD